MYDGASNVQLSSELLKARYPKVSVMSGVEDTVSLFFHDVSKILVVNEIITGHRAIYKLFGSVIYHKPYSIFKSKSHEFHNRHIGSFSANDTRMACYFVGMHRYLCMIKALLDTVFPDEFNTISLNSKLSKVVSYIHDNKA